MELQIATKNVKMTPTLRQYVQRKIGKLTRHLPSILESKVEITAEGTKSKQQRFLVRVTVNPKGTTLHGEERAEDVFSAIDRAADVMTRQIEHFKGKRYEKGRGTSIARGTTAQATPDEAPPGVEIERPILKPMSVSDATDQLEVSGQVFFLFLNPETKEVNLVYKRKNGDYIVIEPETV
jgi:putative sigma-54 modulation protein